ncbi:hypothetical protein NKH77_46955 [Streptomyces sp. M19]
MTGNPGPSTSTSPATPSRASWPTRRPSPTSTRPAPGSANGRRRPSAVAAVAERLLAAERPVIWVGNGANRARAAADVLALAEALNVPVVTTFNGMGAVPTTHPLVFGALSRMGTKLSTRVVAESDLVLALGNSLNAVSTGRWRLRLPQIVQVDVDPTMIGRYYADTTTGVVGDLAAFSRDLTAEVGTAPPPRARAGASGSPRSSRPRRSGGSCPRT